MSGAFGSQAAGSLLSNSAMQPSQVKSGPEGRLIDRVTNQYKFISDQLDGVMLNLREIESRMKGRTFDGPPTTASGESIDGVFNMIPIANEAFSNKLSEINERLARIAEWV